MCTVHPSLWLQNLETTEDTDTWNKIHEGSHGVSKEHDDGESEYFSSLVRAESKSPLSHAYCST